MVQATCGFPYFGEKKTEHYIATSFAETLSRSMEKIYPLISSSQEALSLHSYTRHLASVETNIPDWPGLHPVLDMYTSCFAVDCIKSASKAELMSGWQTRPLY